MALSFSVKFRGHLDRKKLNIVEVTHDGSETSVDCSSLELNYIDYAMNVGATVPVSAGTTALADLTTNSGKYLAMTALSSGALTSIIAIGT
jgi:hypothetical protein